jgi:hypothetical protein
MTTQHISLLIPDLFECISKAQQSIPRLAALETLLARADQHVDTADAYYACACEQFDFEVDSNAIPVAAVSRYADSGRKDDKVWMHVDPVYIEADKDRLILRGSGMLEVDKAESTALLQELNTIYAEDGWLFESFNAARWYVRLPQQPGSCFHDLGEALGRSVEPFLPKGADQTHWHRFMNEVQMLFHASEVNQQRAQQNQYPINSIWCWGPGEIPEQVSADWHAVYAEEPFIRGLAMLADTPVYSVPASAETVIDKASATDIVNEVHMLVVIEPSEEDILSTDINHHLDKLSMLEKNWFAPLLQALKQNRVASVSLLTCNGVKYRLNKHHLRRFWRKRKKISLSNTGE